MATACSQGLQAILIMPSVLKKVDYTWEDFIPLGIYCKGIIHIYVKADAPWKTLADFVADAKNRQIRVGSFGKNTHSDFVIEAFKKEAGIKLINVPYKSCSETVTALLATLRSGLLFFLHGAISRGGRPDFGDCRP